MEPLDAVKNDGNSRSSKRRISSILKAPQTSIRLSDPEQVVTQVEVAKPVEKRNSKRVSFAPANDVLLFSKDAKNASPARSPLQDLSTTTVTNTEKRVQMGVAEETVQTVTGMETLLNAPLHASQQRLEELFIVNQDTEDDCGEKTMMFTADDASMDVTRSHTIIISNDSESHAVLPDQQDATYRNMDFSFCVEKKKSDIHVLPRNVTTSVGLDPEFENFLASLSKQSGPRGNPVIAKVAPMAAPSPQETVDTSGFLPQLKTRRDCADKENQAPASLSTVMQKSSNKTRNIGESSHKSINSAECDVSMDITEAFKGSIMEDSSKNDPLQCLFPTQHLKPHADNLRTTEMTSQQQSSEVLGYTSYKPWRMEVDSDDMELRSCQTRVTEARNLDAVKHLQSLGTDEPVSILNSNRKLAENNTGMDMTASQGGDTKHNNWECDDMEITRSQTVAIDAKTIHALNPLQNKKRKSLAFKTTSINATNILEVECGMELTKVFSESVDHISHSDGSRKSDNPLDSLFPKIDDKMGTPSTKADSDDMELRSCQTRVTEARNLDAVKHLQSLGTDEPVSILNSNRKLAENNTGMDMTASQGGDTKHNNWECDDMEITRSQTVAIDAKTIHALNPLQNQKRKSLAFTTTSINATNILEVECGMELTKVFSESVDHISHSDGSRKSDNPLDSLFPKIDDEMGTPSTKADSDDMEFTRCQTRVIEAKNLHTINPLSFGTGRPVGILDSNKKLFSEDDKGMAITMHQGKDTKYHSYELDDMEITKSQTVAIDAKTLYAIKPLQSKKRNNLSFVTFSPKASDTLEVNCDMKMEMTQALTTAILAKPAQNIPRFSHGDSTMAKVSTTTRNNVEENNLSEMGQLPCHSDDINLTRSNVCLENTGLSNQVLHKERESFLSLCRKTPALGEMIPSSDQTTDKDVKFHVGNKDFNDKVPVTPDPYELEMTNEADESRKVCIANDTSKKTENLDNRPQSSAPFEELTKSFHNIPDGCSDFGDMNITRDKSVPHQVSTHQVNKFSSLNAQTRRKSLADLQSKLRRISNMMKETNDNIAMESCTAPLCQVENDLDTNPIKTKLPECDPEIGCTDNEENAQLGNITQVEPSCVTAPLNMKTKRLTSRYSLRSFIPKLSQMNRPVEPNKLESSHVNSVVDHMKANTINITHQLSTDTLMDNINDEELPNISSDWSETLDTKTQTTGEKESPLKGLMVHDRVFEESFPSVGQGQKRPLAVVYHEDNVGDEKRKKPSPEHKVEMELPSHVVECDSNMTAAPGVITQTIDSSNCSNTANIRCEATFESTHKQSLFESHLEDSTSDIQKKLYDDITVLEFFKFFNLDYVIHNPRQSVLPGKLASDLDLLREKHINYPKQSVYEADLQNLIDKVEGLKAQMKDGEKLKNVNRSLWEEVRGLSEKELKCFGAKLKERSNFFRKRSKAQSHEMKEVLYSKLVQANLEEQQKLRGKMEEADEMLKTLDDCIHELETEIAAVDGKGLEKSNHLGLDKVTQALADDERQMCELEMQKKLNLDKLNKLRTETEDLDSHIAVLHRVNEWKFKEKRDNCTVYTFLYKSLHLMLLFEKCDGNNADDNSERKISDITFKLQLDDEMPESHAHLVHKLLSQYIEGETDWVKKYPTSRCVPKLLHDVGLVVSRCRLLGEEVRLLTMWGGLKLDLLDIRCVDTQICLVFSNLKAFSKFEFSIAVNSSYPFSQLQAQNFRRHTGNTTVSQIEEIVSSVTPAKNYLTKIVKKIHEALL